MNFSVSHINYFITVFIIAFRLKDCPTVFIILHYIINRIHPPIFTAVNSRYYLAV